MLFRKTLASKAVESEMKVVKLNDGSEVAEPVVKTTMTALKELKETNNLVFYDLVEKCRNANYRIFKNAKEVLSKLEFLNDDGSIHSSVKNIVLSSVKGNGRNMKLSSPLYSSSQAASCPVDSKIPMTQLKNGSEVPNPIVITTMMSLENLMETNPIAFYELVQKCRNPEHEMFGNTRSDLEEWALMKDNGSIDPYVKNIILSAVVGEDVNMALTSPVATTLAYKR